MHYQNDMTTLAVSRAKESISTTISPNYTSIPTSSAAFRATVPFHTTFSTALSQLSPQPPLPLSLSSLTVTSLLEWSECPPIYTA